MVKLVQETLRLLLSATCAEQLGSPVRALRLRQITALFTSYDSQMKGEEWVDIVDSP